MDGIINKNYNNVLSHKSFDVLFDKTFTNGYEEYCGININPENYDIIILEATPNSTTIQYRSTGVGGGYLWGNYGVYSRDAKLCLCSSSQGEIKCSYQSYSTGSVTISNRKSSCVFVNNTMSEFVQTNTGKTTLPDNINSWVNQLYNFDFSKLLVGMFMYEGTQDTSDLRGFEITNDFSINIRVLGM